MRKIWFSFLTIVFGVGLIIGGLPSVFAQETDSDEFQLEEITVTAQKRSENQQKVAIAMEVLSAEDLKMTGQNDLDEILSNVSNILVNKSADGLRITLRGFSDDAKPAHGQSVSTPTVAVNMDGVYSSRKDTGSGLFDLDRVEVLFGPQSTMYASNSPGGVVNVETAKPKLDTYEASGTLEYGNYDLLHTEGMVNAPLGDIMALRGAFQTQVRDGYISNGGDDEDSKSARIRALVQPGENVSFILTGELSKTTSHGFGSVNGFENQDDEDDPWTSDNTLPNPSTRTSKKLYGRFDWDMGFGSLSVVPSYSTGSGDLEERMEMGPDITVWKIDTDSEDKSVELRMSSSPDFFFKWLVGFNYYRTKDYRYALSYDGSGNQNIGVIDATGESVTEYRDTDADEEAKAVFANITYPVTDTFRATAGVRKSWDDLTYYNAEVRGVMGGAPGRLEEVIELHEDSYSDPDYKIGVEYDLSENSMIYADYSTSYRVQAFGGGGPGTMGEEAVPPEKLKAYSAGSKNRFFDNRLQVNASAFYYDYENFSAGDMVMAYYGPYDEVNGVIDPAIFEPDATQPDPNSSGYGDGFWYGGDVNITAILSPKDVLNLSVAYLHSEWSDLTFNYYYQFKVVGAPPGMPITPANVEPLEPLSLNGSPMTKSPEWTANASYEHKFSLPNGGTLDARVETRYKSDYELSWRHYADYPDNYQESCFITNLSAAYNNPDGNWSLSAYVRNITDYAEKRNYFGEPVNELTIGSPRTYGAVLTAHF